jgi:hypothetical protein
MIATTSSAPAPDLSSPFIAAWRLTGPRAASAAAVAPR